MVLSQQQIANVENVLRTSLRLKFQNYAPETSAMPFHTRLLGKDRMALFSFIHSLNTTFGTSIFEPVALALASTNFQSAKLKQVSGKTISSESQRVIQNIINKLTTATELPNKPEETKALKEVCKQGQMIGVKLPLVDIKLVDKDGAIYLFDLKTAKPNAGNFKEFKRMLLEWTAAALADDPEANVQSFIAIPYNPYEPEPYNRWTMRGMLDINNELKVADELWDFFGGTNAYTDLLDIFERVGIELRPEIDGCFARFNR